MIRYKYCKMTVKKLLLNCNSYPNVLKIANKRDKHIYKFPRLITDQVLQKPNKTFSFEDEVLNTLKGKITYNSLVTKKNVSTRWSIRKSELNKMNIKKQQATVPISLRYKYGESVNNFEEYRSAIYGEDELQDDGNDESLDEKINLPYNIVKKVDVQLEADVSENPHHIQTKTEHLLNDQPDIIRKKWMSDYEVYEEEDAGDTEEIGKPESIYGTPDPNVLPSKIPCGGCGAHLHCQNPSVPGYIPKEIFLKCNETDLKRSTCQRCIFLKTYNVALSVNVDSETYPKMLASLKNKEALIVLLVDMIDFPCSIWPKLLDIIGHNKPIILVGNKIDLIPGDDPKWLKHAEEVLKQSFPSSANIVAVKLISAKTGFAIEDLITTLFVKHKNKGDVYIIGCTNVGKSSLFNVLLQSDFCKSEASDLIQKATVSPWPGTTLNLLKFPILHLSDWQAFLRINRLKAEHKAERQAKQLEKLQAQEHKIKTGNLPQIIGHIGRTFKVLTAPKNAEEVLKEEFAMPKITNKLLNTDERKVFNEDDKNFKLSKWCYDTPGVIHPDQIINLLTAEELSKTINSTTIHPRFYSIYPEQTLFLGGLARLDLINCEHSICRFIIYASDKLPITICKTEYADEVYNTLLGTIYMGVPCGSVKRLQQWPHLKSAKDFEMKGESHGRITSEIVLSSAGWASFTCAYGKNFVIRPWTPEGRGIHLRETPLLRFTYKQRKSRISNTPTYYVKKNM